MQPDREMTASWEKASPVGGADATERDPSSYGLGALSHEIDKLGVDLERLYTRLGPVLMPPSPIASLDSSVGIMSPLGEQADRLRSMREYLGEIHGRLDL